MSRFLRPHPRKAVNLFRKNDLLKQHRRERFHVTPKDGSSPFSGILVGVAVSNYQFVDVTVGGHVAESPLFIDRANVSYIQAVSVSPSAPDKVVTGVTG